MSTTHLDDETIEALIGGTATDAQRTSAMQHLGDCRSCSALVAEVLNLSRSLASPGGTDPTERLQDGGAFGRLTGLTRLAAGAMGAVYRAFDPTLERTVALKVLHLRGGTEEVARVTAEARAMAKLAHPNVVPLYDVIEHGGSAGLVMELVEGTSLTEWLRGERSVTEVVSMFCQAGRGLAAAHRAGLVHGDFKGDNVIVGADGRPRIADFGLSSPVLRLLGLHTQAAGTPAYMAPERLSGHSSALPSADQFSFCVALHEALTGRHPYDSKNVATLLAAMRKGPPASSGSAVPRRVQAAIRRGLRADPDARFPSVDVLVDELQAAVAPSSRWWVTVAGLAALLSAGAVTWWLSTAVERRCVANDTAFDQAWSPALSAQLEAHVKSVAQTLGAAPLAPIQAALDAYRAQWLTVDRTACREAAQPSTTELASRRRVCLDMRRDAVTTFVSTLTQGDVGVVAAAPTALATMPSVDDCTNAERLMDPSALPVGEARTRALAAAADAAKSLVLGRVEQLKEAATVAEQAVAEASDAGHGPTYAEALYARGSVADFDGRRRDAERDFEAALWKALEANANVVAVRAASDLSQVTTERRADSARWARLADVLSARQQRPFDVEARRLRNEGARLLDIGEVKPGAELLRQSLALYEARLGGDALPTNEVRVSLAKALVALAKFDDAKRLLDLSGEAITKTYGANHPLMAGVLKARGRFFAVQGKLDEEMREYRAAADLLATALGPNHPRAVYALRDVSSALINGEHFEEALAMQRSILEQLERAYGPESYEVTGCHQSLAITYSAMDRFEEALREHRTTLALLRRFNGEDSPDVADELTNIADCEGALGHPAEAERALSEALAKYEQQLGPDHPRVAMNRLSLVQVQLERGQFADALQSLERFDRIAANGTVPPAMVTGAAFTKVMAQVGHHDLTLPAACAAIHDLLPDAKKAPASMGLLPQLEAWLRDQHCKTGP